MVEVKSLDEIVRNYVMSVVTGAYKTKEYWKKKGFDEDRAINKALAYVSGQLEAGINPQKTKEYIKIFRELACISNAIADMLEETLVQAQ
jgi:hypothetical protein